MKLEQLLQGLEILRLEADPELEIGDISYDSRRTKTGDVFVAVRGFQSDGHQYIGSAADNGAVAVICEQEPDCDLPYVLVPDSRLALAICSRNYFGDPGAEMTLIGVTGTNGKTTTTTLIKHMLEFVSDAKVGLIGTNRNMIGEREIETEHTTPESYELQKLLREMSDAGCTHVVMEVSSHSLVLSRVAGLYFEVGVFTNLTQDHLDFHSDMDDYARAKARLFAQCRHGAFNLDDAYAGFMRERTDCLQFCYSLGDESADLTALDVRLTAESVDFDALYGGKLCRVEMGIPGRFSVYNALSVLSTGLLLGLETEDCARSLKTATGVMGRVETVSTDGDYSIVIDYAHTPDALENVLTSMHEVTTGRLVALFGCGGDRDRTKRPKMGAIAARIADFVIVTSDNPRTERPGDIIAEIAEGLSGSDTAHVIIEDRREAIAYAIEHHLPGDVIVLAGKGHETYQIIGREKHHMDEREIVAEILAERS